MEKDNQLRVRSFENNKIIIEIFDFTKWKKENTDAQIKIGSFLKIEDGNYKSVVTMVQSFKMAENSTEEEVVIGEEYSGNFILETYPIGQLEQIDSELKFIKGLKNINIPPTSVSILSEEELQIIFQNKNQPFTFSKHSSNNNIEIIVDGDKFFSKHLAVVGSTGSGKSCTVAKIIQDANNNDNSILKNTHILIFDIHGEYSSAFEEDNARYLSIEDDSLILPYWLMNSEELEDFFIESNEANSHNQISQFKKAVICNKKRHNPDLDVTYDSPVYFNLKEVITYLDNKNRETLYVAAEQEYYALLDKNIVYSEEGIPDEMWTHLNFLQLTGNSKHPILNSKVSKGSFYGEFDRFLSRFETKILDERLNFMLETKEYTTKDFYHVMRNILGYSDNDLDNSNITIIDLSSLPFEIVSIVVSIITRFSFEFCYHKTKLLHTNDTPYLLVFEEAHKYIPKLSDVKYKNTRIAVERVAKEGRKYGLSAMIVSQRPSEISPTVFSQCNNFVVMRLTNPDDQSYVKRLLPDNLMGYTDSLAVLETKEALLVGDSISTPCIVKINDANPLPKSEDIKFLKEWRQEWKKVSFEKVFSNIIRKKEGEALLSK